MSILTKSLKIAALAAALATAAVAPAHAAATIDVQLWDKGAQVEMMLNMGKTMMPMDMHMAPMGITVSTDTVPAGEVTFAVTNISKEVIHEMVLSPLANAEAVLPFDAANQKVDEDAAGHLGEVAELDPGASGSLTLTLKPGLYILFCNIPGHFTSGMWTLVTVK
jgi:uncharacterized cupredoxin-like copper-binding protein